MQKKVIKKNILEKLVRDNSFHKIIANKFEYSERRIEQWFYRELIDSNIFCKLYNYRVIIEIAEYLNISTEEVFE